MFVMGRCWRLQRAEAVRGVARKEQGGVSSAGPTPSQASGDRARHRSLLKEQRRPWQDQRVSDKMETLSATHSHQTQLCPPMLWPSCAYYPKAGFASVWMLSQKMQPSQRAGEGRSYYLWQVRRSLGIFPKEILLAFNLFSRYKDTFPLKLIITYTNLVNYTFEGRIETLIFCLYLIPLKMEDSRFPAALSSTLNQCTHNKTKGNYPVKPSQSITTV